MNRDSEQCEFRLKEYSRIVSVKTAWTNLREESGTQHITLHDLRRYHNTKLREHGFSHEESGTLIGNSERVNRLHYDPLHDERVLEGIVKKRKQVGRIVPVMRENIE
ncbi:MAG: hypothetical protein HQM11_18265 [SAR324 cluster bacterium]|nr:hypothetical protein [SAR324 cluster bacterium]